MEHGEDPLANQVIEQVGETLVAYSDTEFCEVHTAHPVEEVALQWLDGSSTTIQMRRRPGWHDGLPEWQAGQAAEFHYVVRTLVQRLLSGEKSVQLDVVADEQGIDLADPRSGG